MLGFTMWQHDNEETQIFLGEILGKMIDALDAGGVIEPKLYDEAEEQIKELIAHVNSLRKDLEKLKTQQSSTA
jgi:hypothetical protein